MGSTIKYGEKSGSKKIVKTKTILKWSGVRYLPWKIYILRYTSKNPLAPSDYAKKQKINK
jgi:hypothetical protein